MYSINSNYYRLIFVGRPSIEKGLEDLLNALEILKDYKWSLTIVGEIHPSIDLSYYSRRSINKIINIGPVQNTQIPSLLNRNQILIVPSHYENFGQIIIEAMACGKAIIASRTGGIKDIIIHKENGLFFKPQNFKDLVYSPPKKGVVRL
jgi:glycosyltransferase involved in cell wall biosynthesis